MYGKCALVPGVRIVIQAHCATAHLVNESSSLFVIYACKLRTDYLVCALSFKFSLQQRTWGMKASRHSH